VLEWLRRMSSNFDVEISARRELMQKWAAAQGGTHGVAARSAGPSAVAVATPGSCCLPETCMSGSPAATGPLALAQRTMPSTMPTFEAWRRQRAEEHERSM
jgi:hypothetical protein